MARNIFRPEGLIYRVLNFLTDLFFLSLLFAVCCIPVVTIGSAASALYDSVAHCVRGREEGPYRRFFRTFRSEFGKMCLTTLLWIVILLFGLWMLDSLGELAKASAETSRFFRAFYMFYYVLMLIPAAVGAGLLLRALTMKKEKE